MPSKKQLVRRCRITEDAEILALERYRKELPLNLDEMCLVTGLTKNRAYRIGHLGPRFYTSVPNGKRGNRIYLASDVQEWIESQKKLTELRSRLKMAETPNQRKRKLN
jgi:predicted DNA-binding transcriptional regulator AlpA